MIAILLADVDAAMEDGSDESSEAGLSARFPAECAVQPSLTDARSSRSISSRVHR